MKGDRCESRIEIRLLRRTAVRNLERADVPRSVAMKLTGHKTESVYRRYAIADSRALAEGVEKLARLHAAPAERPPVAGCSGVGRAFAFRFRHNYGTK